jgi:stress-induced morphogen
LLLSQFVIMGLLKHIATATGKLSILSPCLAPQSSPYSVECRSFF